MADDKQIKDGLGNVFTVRMKDVSPNLDGTVQRSMVYASLYPLDYGSGGGSFQHVAKSGTIAAMLPLNSPIYSFRWPSPGMVALIWRIRLMAWTVTAFSGGLASFDLFAARSFTSSDGAGNTANFGGESNQLRTIMSESEAAICWSNTGALTPGIRTLDAAPMESMATSVPTSDNAIFQTGPIVLFQKDKADHPLVLAQNEGFVIAGSVPQTTSTWAFSVTLEWDELQNY
jgi:hypothetical protein